MYNNTANPADLTEGGILPLRSQEGFKRRTQKLLVSVEIHGGNWSDHAAENKTGEVENVYGMMAGLHTDNGGAGVSNTAAEFALMGISPKASVPAGSRNSSASVTAGGFDPAASRNRPAVNSAGRPNPTGRVGQAAHRAVAQSKSCWGGDRRGGTAVKTQQGYCRGRNKQTNIFGGTRVMVDALQSTWVILVKEAYCQWEVELVVSCRLEYRKRQHKGHQSLNLKMSTIVDELQQTIYVFCVDHKYVIKRTMSFIQAMVLVLWHANADLQKRLAKLQRQVYEAKDAAVTIGVLLAGSNPAGGNPAGSFQPAGSYEPAGQGNPAVSTSVFTICGSESSSYNKKGVYNSSPVLIFGSVHRFLEILLLQFDKIAVELKKSSLVESAFIDYIQDKPRTNSYRPFIVCLFASFLQGHRQGGGIDYDEMDVQGAFLMEKLKKKSLEPAYARLSAVCKHITEKRHIDKTLFIRKIPGLYLWYRFYVDDDIIFGSTIKPWCEEFEVLMKGEFEKLQGPDIIFAVSDWFLTFQVKSLTSHLTAVDGLISAGSKVNFLAVHEEDYCGILLQQKPIVLASPEDKTGYRYSDMSKSYCMATVHDWKLLFFDVATSFDSAVHRVHAVSFDAAVLDVAATVSAACIIAAGYIVSAGICDAADLEAVPFDYVHVVMFLIFCWTDIESADSLILDRD
ncbi:hypothetical protein Tco_1078560 [Tanacetum coccineum]|uniref:Uncharacterized protein n=1 Tax=Tanacetum coccineum TaxID=301880 RepID=A0ABQ5HQZ4_9ASTR